MNNPILEHTALDKRLKLYRAVAGVLPGGSLIVEYLVDHVPSKRAERLATYIEELNCSR